MIQKDNERSMGIFSVLYLAEYDLLTIGVVNDMFTEKENDEYDGWSEVAGQADFDAF